LGAAGAALRAVNAALLQRQVDRVGDSARSCSRWPRGRGCTQQFPPPLGLTEGWRKSERLLVCCCANVCTVRGRIPPWEGPDSVPLLLLVSRASRGPQITT